MFDEYEDIITVEQLMEMLSIGRNTVYKLLNDPKNGIRSVRVGNRHRIPKAAVISYIIKKSRGGYSSLE